MNNTDRKPKGYWTKERCYNLAKKCKTANEFRKLYNSAYNAAHKNKWIKEYTWFNRSRKGQNVKWTYDACYKEAKKYKTLKEFKRNCSSAHTTAYKNGWMKDYTWLELPRTAKKYTYEYFISVVKKYTTLKDFRENEKNLYNCAKRHKWLNAEKFQSLARSTKPYGYWTKERCQKLALKYNTISEFRINESGAYSAARNKGWLEEITSHMKTKVPSEEQYRHKHIIYVYKDEINHYVYVGLTNCIKRRHKDHCDKDINDVLYQHFAKHNLEIPNPEIVYDNLTPHDAQNKEKEVYYQYRDAGWNMINAESSLGSLGSHRKWTFKKCYAVAKKYKTKKRI